MISTILSRCQCRGQNDLKCQIVALRKEDNDLTKSMTASKSSLKSQCCHYRTSQ